MILAEKLFQKLNNLKSKKEIKDFFINFNEYRSLTLSVYNSFISHQSKPTEYEECSNGNYIIVWDDEFCSYGSVNTSSVHDFDEFLTTAARIKRPYNSPIFIAERGVYPLALTYSKALADMIDIPEYVLKVLDLSSELDKMLKANSGTCAISIKDATRYAYSSRNMDEYFSYTKFILSKTIGDVFAWEYEACDIYSISKFEEVFSFFGDVYNGLINNEIAEHPITEIILSPNVFEKLFRQTIIDSIKAESIQAGLSPFTKDDFSSRNKVLGTLSLSYDPLINYAPGSYKFTSFGLKAKRQYFIKYGKLDAPISTASGYSEFNQAMPSMEVESFTNLKIEGLKKKSFNEVKKASNTALFIIEGTPEKVSFTESKIVTTHSTSIENGKFKKGVELNISLDLIDLIKNNKVEMVEFIDGRFGCKISLELTN